MDQFHKTVKEALDTLYDLSKHAALGEGLNAKILGQFLKLSIEVINDFNKLSDIECSKYIDELRDFHRDALAFRNLVRSIIDNDERIHIDNKVSVELANLSTNMLSQLHAMLSQ